MPYLLIITNVLLMTIGQLLFKQTAIFSNNHPELNIFAKFLLNPWLYFAGLSFAAATIAYVRILTTMQLSLAYPLVTALAYTLTIFGSLYFFGERLNMVNFWGILFIILGVSLTTLR